MLQTIAWTGEAARLLDQTRLPAETVYVDVVNEKQMWDAIRRLVVRGAPAIGVAAAFGVYLGVREHKGREIFGFYDRLNEVCDYLATSRPTAVNLFWAIDRMRRTARDAGRATHSIANPDYAIDVIKQRLLAECLTMLDEDTAVCRAIGEHGAELLAGLKRSDEAIGAGAALAAGTSNQHTSSPADASLPAAPLHILTHCNAGGLATVCYGTALAPIYVGAERGMTFHIWSDETRPLLQGSRITAFELHANSIPVTVICDSMAATVMQQGRVDAVIVGADRVAANGDVANKIGTLGVAILARHFGIPFFAAAPTSTIDLATPGGGQIPIEERDPREITHGFGRQTAPEHVEVYNPAFDVTPAGLVTAIITEKGVLRPPYADSLRAVCNAGVNA